MPSRPAIAVRWMIALVEPPIASSTRSAFSTDFCGDDLVGRQPGLAPARPRARPLASATRSRSACTAGMAAVPGSAMPSASAMQAMVLAVPITAQVPAVVARLPSTSSISSRVDLAGAVASPRSGGSRCRRRGARRGSDVGHHRAGDELDRRQVGRGRAHQLRRHGLVAAADQHHRVHRLGADHLLDVHRHEVAEHHAGRAAGTPRRARSVGNSSGSAAGREHAALHRLDQLGEVPVAVVEAAAASRRCRRPGRASISPE